MCSGEMGIAICKSPQMDPLAASAGKAALHFEKRGNHGFGKHGVRELPGMASAWQAAL